jgi:hypothetical protein
VSNPIGSVTLPPRGTLWRRVGKKGTYRVDCYIYGRLGVERIELHRIGSRGIYAHPTLEQLASNWTPVDADNPSR